MSYQRSGTTTAAGVVNYVIAGLTFAVGAFLGVAVLLAGSSTSNNSTDAHKALVAVGGFIAVVILVVGAAMILIGRAFMRGKSWARVTLIVLYALGVFSSLSRMSQGGTVTLGLFIDITMVVLLLLPSTGRDFGPRTSYSSPYPQSYNQPQTHPAFLGTPYATPAAYQPPVASGPVAGWYADPHNAAGQRYWDGTAWTAHTQPGAVPTR
jgi:hypothetical protein